MTPGLSYLLDRGLLDWATLAAGYSRGWISPADLSELAVLEVLAKETPSAEVIALTAVGLPDQDVRDLLDQLAAMEGGIDTHRAVRLLLLAHLRDLEAERASGTLNDDQVVDRLEDLYAEFDYPEELRYCSRYNIPPEERGGSSRGGTAGSPLRAFREAIQKLAADLANC